VQVDDSPGFGEAEAEAAAGFAAGEEGVEDVGADVGRDAGAGVGDGEEEVRSRPAKRVPRCGVRDWDGERSCFENVSRFMIVSCCGVRVGGSAVRSS